MPRGESIFEAQGYHSGPGPRLSQISVTEHTAGLSAEGSAGDSVTATNTVQVRKRTWGVAAICWEAVIFLASLILASAVITTFIWALGPSGTLLDVVHSVRPASNSSDTISRDPSEFLWGPCGSASCMDQSNALRKLLNTSIDPCSDFYGYVCHNWALAHPLRTGQERTSADDIVEATFSDLLTAAVRDDQTKYVDLHALFQTCLEPKKSLYDELLEAALSMLQLGSLKEVGSHTWTDNDLSARLGKAHRYLGIDALFRFSRTEETENRSYIAVHEPSTVLVRSALSDTDRESAKDYFEPVLSYFRKIFYTDILVFEERLSSLFQRRRKPEYLEETPVLGLADLPLIKRLHWPTLLAAAFDDFSRTTRVRLAAPEYVFRLAVDDGVPPASDVIHYLVFRVVMALLPFTDDKRLRDSFASLAYKRFPEMYASSRRTMSCVQFLDHFEPNLPLFVAHHLSESVIGGPDFTRDLLQHLQTVFREGLLKSRSFSNVLRGHLLKKLDALSWEVLVPAFLLNSTVREVYTGMTYPDSSKVESSSFLTSFFERSQHRPPHSWRNGLLSSYPRSPYPLCRIQVPPAVFALSLTGDVATKSLQISRVAPRIFGTLFDLLHSWTRSYDRGRPRRFARAYDSLRVCLARDYARMSWGARHAPPLNASESRPWQDLWDVLALGPAYEALHTYLARKRATLRLAYADGQYLDARRLFFVYYAANLCEHASPRYYTWIAGDRTRSPSWYRVNGPLRNSHDFAEAFACKPGSFMNPVRKCSLPGWD